MRIHRYLISFFAVILLFTASLPAISASSRAVNARASKAYGKLPLSFVENKGQMDNRARFVVQGPRASAFFRNDGVTFELWKPDTKAQKDDPIDAKSEKPAVQKHAVLKLTFENADPRCRVQGMGKLSGKVNRMIGNDKSKWQTDIPTFKGVIYKNAWPGIDVIYRGNRRQLKYDIRVNPGADVANVQLRYDGAKRIWLDKKGGLHIRTAVTDFIERVPGIYQIKDGKKINISGGYKLLDAKTVGFSVKNADPSLALIIDPAADLIYSTFLSGTEGDWQAEIAVDSSGCAYVAGCTISIDFPVTEGAFDTTPDDYATDMFITKLNASGSDLVYSTFIGGTSAEIPEAITLDSTGCVYVTGYLRSSDFPVTPGAYDTSFNGGASSYDGFLTKLNPSGTGLEFSTFFDATCIYDVAVDTSGCAYITGYETSITTEGAFDRTFNGWFDSFIAKFNASGSGLVYSTLLGGSDADFTYAIAVDSSGCAYVTGSTFSRDFPVTAGAFDTQLNPVNGGALYHDAFVTKLNAAGSALEYSTYLGGSESDIANDIVVDSTGCAYVAGSTGSYDFPTTFGVYDRTNYSGDAFITKINPAGNGLVYSTFLGGNFSIDSGMVSSADVVNSIAVDDTGCIYVTGLTSTIDFPTTTGALKRTHNSGDQDMFVAKFDPSLSKLLYSTYLGGTDNDGLYGPSMAIGSSGNVYVTGMTNSSDFPVTAGSFSHTFGGYKDNGGGGDRFVAKIWTLPVPLNISLTPKVGNLTTDQKTTLTSTYWDQFGASNIRTCYLLLSKGANRSGAGYFFYDTVKNKLYLRKTDEAVMIGGYTPGSSKIIDNGCITLYCGSTSVQRNGGYLTVNWSIAAKPYYLGERCYPWMQAANKSDLLSSWQQMGSYNILIYPAPVNVSLTPNAGVIAIDQKTSLSSVYSDPAGYANIKNCYMAVNTGATTTGAGYFFYDAIKNKLYLRKTNESVMIGGYAPGSANVIDNGSIILYCADTTLQKVGKDMTINWSIALKPYFAGNQCTASMQVTNKAGLSDPMQQMGSFSTE